MTINAAIIGATGYVGGELLRLLAAHPQFEVAAAVSASHSGNPLAATFPHLARAYGDQVFAAPGNWVEMLDIGSQLALFSAAPHGASAAVVAETIEAAARRNLELHIVDSSADFRYAAAEDFASVYGSAHAAPELLEMFVCAVPEHLQEAPTPHIGHPGCFATAMLLGAMPLVTSEVVENELFISGITGSTGSGRSPQEGTHHPERNSNLYAYKPLSHRHVPEVEKLLQKNSGHEVTVNFVPHSGPFARGIYATIQARLRNSVSSESVHDSIRSFYANSDFVNVVDGTPRLKDVVASNYCHIGVAVEGESVAVMAAIDNLVKGAAGGAIQWMNRLWELPESSGLTAAAPAWT